MNSCEVRVRFSDDVPNVLDLVADELEKLGYKRKSLEATELKMSIEGRWVTTDPRR